MAVAAATVMVIVNTVVHMRDVLGGGDTLVTVAYAASGGGSMLAALLLPRVLDRIAERTAMLVGCRHGCWDGGRNDDAFAAGSARPTGRLSR
jgi:hypothetical protein